jgi:hypothetical protein
MVICFWLFENVFPQPNMSAYKEGSPRFSFSKFHQMYKECAGLNLQGTSVFHNEMLELVDVGLFLQVLLNWGECSGAAASAKC